MAKLISTAVGSGLLGIGIAYIGYRLYCAKSSTAGLRSAFVKQKIKPAKLQRKDKRANKVSSETLEKIKTAESQHFTGISKALALSPEQVNQMKTYLVAKWMIELKEDGSNLMTFSDILNELRDNGILGPVNYLDVVQVILQETGLVVTEKGEKLLESLRDVVIDHMEADLSDRNRNAWDSDSKKVDILLMYADEDCDLAEQLRQNIYKHVQTKDVSVKLKDDFGVGMPIFRGFEEALRSSIYTFVLVTARFSQDELAKFLAASGLLENLTRSEKLWRVVPVWMEPNVNERDKCPLEFSILQGLHFHRYLEDETETLCFRQIDKLITEGRRKEMEQSTRENLQE